MTERRDQAESGRTWTSAAPMWLIVSVLPDNFPDEERAIMVPMSICNGTHKDEEIDGIIPYVADAVPVPLF